MLEMWKVVDPYCKCAAYFTDEEQQFDYNHLAEVQKALKSAVQVKAIIDGQETTLWKVTFVDNDREKGKWDQYLLHEDGIRWGLDVMARYLEAHHNKTRVDVTAKEVKSPEQWDRAKESLTKHPMPNVSTSPAAKFPGQSGKKRRPTEVDAI